ncbi:hypothetical protein NKJ26_04610 [Mesorhizobium sp. M0152]|uniref:hypothetical protein n=1 Tax=Mesorhizobium sp. M0152 TaxID=2956898 RepID=UPI00333AD99E
MAETPEEVLLMTICLRWIASLIGAVFPFGMAEKILKSWTGRTGFRARPKRACPASAISSRSSSPAGTAGEMIGMAHHHARFCSPFDPVFCTVDQQQPKEIKDMKLVILHYVAKALGL